MNAVLLALLLCAGISQAKWRLGSWDETGLKVIWKSAPGQLARGGAEVPEASFLLAVPPGSRLKISSKILEEQPAAGPRTGTFPEDVSVKGLIRQHAGGRYRD